MKNKELKQRLVKDDTYNAFCWNVYVNRLKRVYEDNPELYGLTDEEFEACNQLRDAKNKAWSRIYQHINYWGLKYGFSFVFFITLTFNDDTLKLTADTRKQLVRRTLQNNCVDYIANIDFGAIGEREHYHAVIVPKIDKMPYTAFKNGKERIIADWLEQKYAKYGFYSIEAIKECGDDVVKVGRYIAKLTNHSIKVKQTKIMTKKDSDYQRFIDVYEKTRYHDAIVNTRVDTQRTFNRLEEVFGKGNIDVL